MTVLIPNRFLFSFEFPLRYRKTDPAITADLSGFNDDDRLPSLSEIDGRQEFGDLWGCWNDSGLFIACKVEGKSKALRCDPKKFWVGDNLRLCIDTRDARTNKRATRYCHQFYLLPIGGGPKGKSPVAAGAKIQRARENAPIVAASRIKIASNVTPTAYSIAAHIPADCLNGFDPTEHARIGFYYILEDSDFGQQYLTVGDDLNWHIDPSTWATAVLNK